MKKRNSFVANSSSSSFIITDPSHEGALKMLEEGFIDNFDDEFTDGDDNETWNWCSVNGFDWDEFLEQTRFDG